MSVAAPQAPAAAARPAPSGRLMADLLNELCVPLVRQAR